MLVNKIFKEPIIDACTQINTCFPSLLHAHAGKLWSVHTHMLTLALPDSTTDRRDEAALAASE